MEKLTFLTLSILAGLTLSHTPEEWRSRTIYQLLTDRFARSNGDITPCGNFSDYCGGTFQGIINNLDYIQHMGFDAIWISPVVLNIPHGYHGYWAKNLFEISPEFGGPKGLKALVEACHKRDIWIMVDVVANHMGSLKVPGDFSHMFPFNMASHYHTNVDCFDVNPYNQTQMETCWLYQLPDLNQGSPFVHTILLTWIQELVHTYNIDGLRVDTAPYVPKHFWRKFSEKAGVYTIGEVANSNTTYVAEYQGPLDAVLNYPLFFTLREAFVKGNNGSMRAIQEQLKVSKEVYNDTSILGNFVDNHDNPRFLNVSSDPIAFRSALALSLTFEGIPIVYYGTEQLFHGGNDPYNREPLWTAMQEGNETFGFLKKIISFRKSLGLYDLAQIERYVDDQVYSFSRGDYFFAFTNSKEEQNKEIRDHPFAENTVICNILAEVEAVDDCVVVKNGGFNLKMVNGEVKIYSIKKTAFWERLKRLFEEKSF